MIWRKKELCLMSVKTKQSPYMMNIDAGRVPFKKSYISGVGFLNDADAQELQCFLACEITSYPGKYRFILCLRGSDISKFVRTWVSRVSQTYCQLEALIHVSTGRIGIHEWMEIMTDCALCHKYRVHRIRQRICTEKKQPESLDSILIPLVRVFGKSDKIVNLLIKGNYVEDMGPEVWSTIPRPEDTILIFVDNYFLCGAV